MTDVSETDTVIIYALSWMAVRSHDPTAVLQALGLGGVQECPVVDGLAAAGLARALPPPPTTLFGALFGKRRRVEPPPKKCFVAEPIDGWTLVFANDLAFEETLLAQLSRRFGEAQAFYSDAKHDGFAWKRARAGELIRSVVVSDGSAEVVGEGQPPEPTVGEDGSSRVDEYDVLRVARAWSVDPNALVRAAKPGRLGALP